MKSQGLYRSKVESELIKQSTNFSAYRSNGDTFFKVGKAEIQDGGDLFWVYKPDGSCYETSDVADAVSVAKGSK